MTDCSGLSVARSLAVAKPADGPDGTKDGFAFDEKLTYMVS